jgi:hypothetical protein
LVRAWHLTEGDQAFEGETVVVLYRDAFRHTITVVWDTGRRAQLDGASWISVMRRAFDADLGSVTLCRQPPAIDPISSNPMTASDQLAPIGPPDGRIGPLDLR